MPTPDQTAVSSATTARAETESGPTESRQRANIMPICPDDLLPMAYGLSWRGNGSDRFDPAAGDAPSSPTADSTSNTDLESHDDQLGKINVSAVEDVDGPVSKGSTPVEDAKMSLHRNRRSLSGSPSASTESNAMSLAANRSMQWEYSSIRLLPAMTSCFLQPGSQFVGNQQSDKMSNKVHVEIKHVDMRESFLCGFLCIENLTPENPTLTTYFEGEIIGNKYAFQTQRQEWGANPKVDSQHWGRFSAFKPYSTAAKNADYRFKNFNQKEHIFMRWKEQFLVPDHRVKTISGASFEGFYYICFSQVTGNISGIYFHSNSERYQQLELKHVPNRGVCGAMEFR